MRARFVIYTVVLIVIIGAIELLFQTVLLSQYQSQVEAQVGQRLAPIRVGIEKDIVTNLLVIQGAANYISVHPELSEHDFSLYAQGALGESSLLKNLAAAPDLLMRFVYPLKGNEGILGMNYRTLPKQWPQVKHAIDTGRMVIAGPIKLVQGGTGLIGRVPVYIKRKKADDRTDSFWGIVSAVIDTDKLFMPLESANVTDLKIAIRGVDGKGANGAVFWGDPAVFDPAGKPILLEVSFPSGEWVIAAMPKDGWPDSHPLAFYVQLVAVVFFVLFLWGGYRDIKNRHVVERAKQDLDKAQSIVNLGNWRLDAVSGVTEWSDETYRIFGVSKHDFIPSLDKFLSLVHPDDRETVQKAFEKSIDEKGLFSTVHRIVRPDGAVRYVREMGENEYTDKGVLLCSFGTVQDITEREVIAKKLQAEQAKLRAMAEATYDPLIMIDSTDTILFWSPAAEKAFGWTAEEALGQKMHPLITPREYLEPAQAGLRHFAKTGKGPVLDSVMEFPAVKKNGDVFPVERSVSAFQVDGQNYAVGMLRDITERKEIEAQLEHLATTDELTGLYNRRRFIELALLEINRSKRTGNSTSLIMFDADKFKSVNDTYGHDVGDDVLVSIAKTTLNCLREVDSFGRIGGEEFVVLLPETPLEGAMVVAERIRNTIEKTGLTLEDGTELHYTVSLGVTELNKGETDFDQFLRRADGAMYRAKQNGRNRIESD